MSANVDVAVEADCLQGNSKCKPKTTTSTTTAYATTTVSAEEWTRVACEHQNPHHTHKTCTMPTSASCHGEVRYGYGNKWITKNMDGQFQCSNGVFTDPSYGQAKECQCKTPTTVAATTTTTLSAEEIEAQQIKKCSKKFQKSCTKDRECKKMDDDKKKKCLKKCKKEGKNAWQDGQCSTYTTPTAAPTTTTVAPVSACDLKKLQKACAKDSECKKKDDDKKAKCLKKCKKQAKKACTPPADATTTTTAAPVVEAKTLPETNCPMPEDSKVCHFWGDPHFTHLFFEEKLYSKNILPGSVITLKGGKEGKFCADDGESGVRCNRGAIGGWEKFTVVDAGGGKVALKGGQNGKYCADENHADPPRIVCNRDKIGGWEKFSVMDKDGAVALRGGKNNKFCADEGDKMNCNRDHVQGWETFTITVHQEGHAWTAEQIGQGGRQTGSAKLKNFNPSGLFKLAQSEDGNFEAQTFFCPAFGKTTTSVAVAMRIGDDVVQMVRGVATEPKSDDKSHLYYHTKLSPKEKENKFMKFYLNGQRMSWEELGEATGTRGQDVPAVGGGVPVGEAGFMQQMHTTLESEKSMLPVCVGDGKHTLVEVSTPWFNEDKQRVFESAVTVRMQKPAASGMCGISPEEMEGDAQRVAPKKSLFTSRQIELLCDMCRLEKDEHDICGAPSQEMSPAEVCAAVGASYEEAKAACGADFDGDWLEACAMETCVGGPAATVLAKIEEQIALEGGSQQ
jgi:hypothetical protein